MRNYRTKQRYVLNGLKKTWPNMSTRL